MQTWQGRLERKKHQYEGGQIENSVVQNKELNSEHEHCNVD